MWTWSHLMISTIVLGPSPEAFIGTLVPDTFDYLNWINHFGKKKVTVSLLLKDEEKFNKKNNSGLIWEIDQSFHSFICTTITIGISLYSLQNGNLLLFNFFASWSLHTLADYLTHTDQIYPFFPFFKKIGLRLGLVNYNPHNWKIMLLGDLVLFILMVIRLKYFP